MNEPMLPEVLDNLPPPPPMQLQHSIMQQQQMPQTSCGTNMRTGVYTLTEEPELEAEENTTM